MKVKITLTEEMLGSQSNNKDVQREFISSKGPNAQTLEEEVASVGVEETIEKGMTVFCRDENGKPFIFDYVIKGFFKDSCSALARCKDTKSSKIKAFKKIIDGCIFPEPRKIMLELPAGTTIGNCQRPLRGQTAQGERIALANSETVPIGTSIEVNIVIMNADFEELVEEWLDYGKYKGLGQWRNSGKGRFTWAMV
jgi:hypothetical protein